MLERAQILAEGHLLTTDDLPESVVESGPTAAGADEDPRRPAPPSSVATSTRFWSRPTATKCKRRGRWGSAVALYRLLEKYQRELPEGSEEAKP